MRSHRVFNSWFNILFEIGYQEKRSYSNTQNDNISFRIIFQSKYTCNCGLLETFITDLHYNLCTMHLFKPWLLILVVQSQNPKSNECYDYSFYYSAYEWYCTSNNISDRPSQNIRTIKVLTITYWVVPFFNLDVSLPKQANKWHENTDGHYIFYNKQILILLQSPKTFTTCLFYMALQTNMHLFCVPSFSFENICKPYSATIILSWFGKRKYLFLCRLSIILCT